MEVIEKVEQRNDFKMWNIKNHSAIFRNYSWLYIPDTAKLALIAEWLREEKGVKVIADIDRQKEVWFAWLFTDVLHNYYEESTSYNKALAKGIEEALKLIDE